MLFGRRPSYWLIGGAGRFTGRLAKGIGTGVGVEVDPGFDGVVSAPAPGGPGCGEFRGPGGLGLGAGRGGGEEPTWANSSLNIQTPVWRPTPVHTTPGALSSEPTPISVYLESRMLALWSELAMNAPLMV